MRASGAALSLAGLILAIAPASAQEANRASTPADSDSQAQAQAAEALRTRWAVIDVSDAAFRQLDTDHDGRISALEANANPKVAARFLEADRNRDGYLSPQEFKSLGEVPAPVANPSPSPSPRPNPDLP